MFTYVFDVYQDDFFLSFSLFIRLRFNLIKGMSYLDSITAIVKRYGSKFISAKHQQQKKKKTLHLPKSNQKGEYTEYRLHHLITDTIFGV